MFRHSCPRRNRRAGRWAWADEERAWAADRAAGQDRWAPAHIRSPAWVADKAVELADRVCRKAADKVDKMCRKAAGKTVDKVCRKAAGKAVDKPYRKSAGRA